MMPNLDNGHRREIMKAEIKTRILYLNCVFIFILCLPCFGQEATIFQQRRQKLADRIEKGIVIIQSSERNQNNLYEFFVIGAGRIIKHFTYEQMSSRTLIFKKSDREIDRPRPVGLGGGKEIDLFGVVEA